MMTRYLLSCGGCLLAVLGTLCAFSGPAGAAVLTFQEGVASYTGTRDTHVGGDNRGAEPVTPHGNLTAMNVYEREVSLNNFYRSLVGFDLTSISPGTQVGSATLTLYVSGSAGNQNVLNSLYAVSLANLDWTEGGATWNNRDQAGPTPWAGSAGLSTPGTDYVAAAISTAVTPGNVSGTPMTFTLDAAGVATVQDWIDNPANNSGFFIRQPDGTFSVDSFFSSEAAALNFHPLLTITTFVPPPIPEPATWTLLALGTAGLTIHARRRAAR